MKYEVMNKGEASRESSKIDAPITAIISITDCGQEKNKFCQRDWLTVLELQFDDVDAGRKGCITTRQAREIADFVLRVRNKVERIIVHCEFGQSRSAGVAAAISQYLEGHDSGIFRNPAYFPNKTCYRYVLDALRKTSIFRRSK